MTFDWLFRYHSRESFSCNMYVGNRQVDTCWNEHKPLPSIYTIGGGVLQAYQDPPVSWLCFPFASLAPEWFSMLSKDKLLLATPHLYIDAHTFSSKLSEFNMGKEISYAMKSPSGGGRTTNALKLNSTFSDPHLRCLDSSFNFFFINFCNICSPHTDLHSVEHHHSSPKPHLLHQNTGFGGVWRLTSSWAMTSLALERIFHHLAKT